MPHDSTRPFCAYASSHVRFGGYSSAKAGLPSHHALKYRMSLATTIAVSVVAILDAASL